MRISFQLLSPGLRLAVAVSLSASCSPAKSNKLPSSEPPTEGSTAPARAVLGDAGAAPTQGDEDNAQDDEQLELEFKAEAFLADLDGKGGPDSISWGCERALQVRVGAARSSEPLQLAEIMGCSAAVVALRPKSPTPALIVTVHEHEEAGPDLHFLYTYDGSKLTRIWTQTGDLSFKRDGSWSISTTECSEADQVYRTTSSVMTWNGVAVKTTESISTEPLGSDGCFEP